MKTQNIISVAIRGLAAVALSVGAASSFGATTWTTSFSNCSGANPSLTATNCGSPGSGSTLTSVSGVNSKSDEDSVTVYGYSSSGLGLVSKFPGTNYDEANTGPGSTGPHAIDNYYGIEGIVFTYSGLVNLKEFKIGWNGTDNRATSSVGSNGDSVVYDGSDISLFAWLGAGAPISTSNFVSSTTNTASGWVRVKKDGFNDDFLNVGANNSEKQSVSSSFYSSYWLISAYTGGGSKSSTDAFKILAVSGQACDKTLVGNECKTPTTPPGNQVPEPGSLALLGLGAMGMIAARRRQQRQQNLAA